MYAEPTMQSVAPQVAPLTQVAAVNPAFQQAQTTMQPQQPLNFTRIDPTLYRDNVNQTPQSPQVPVPFMGQQATQQNNAPAMNQPFFVPDMKSNPVPQPTFFETQQQTQPTTVVGNTGGFTMPLQQSNQPIMQGLPQVQQQPLMQQQMVGVSPFANSYFMPSVGQSTQQTQLQQAQVQQQMGLQAQLQVQVQQAQMQAQAQMQQMQAQMQQLSQTQTQTPQPAATTTVVPAEVEAPPCTHNQWDNLRATPHIIFLRCRECHVRWKTRTLREQRCPSFTNNDCPKHNACPLVHVFRFKLSSKNRRRRERTAQAAGEGDAETTEIVTLNTKSPNWVDTEC